MKNCIIRLERKEERHEVENLVRESFWNVYRLGCLEHYLLHVLRNCTDFISELDFVLEKDGKIIGQNVFVKATVKVICTPKVRHFWRCIFLWAKQDEKTEGTRQNLRSVL